MNCRMKFKKLLCFAMLLSLILPNKLVYADDLANDNVESVNQDAICDGWKYIHDDWYYFNSSKEPGTKWQFINGNWYYFNNDGKMVSDQFVDGYYVNNSGAYVSDAWAKNAKGWWYRYGDGSYPANEIVTIGSSKYHFSKQGYMSVGWICLDGWYYANKSGSLAVGWNYINGNWYYFSTDGKMSSNQYVDGYYVDNSGAYVSDAWAKNAKGWWYRYGDGSYPANEIVTIGSSKYHFSKQGYMSVGWICSDGWYYANKSGSLVVGWNYINGQWYYFNSDFLMLSGLQQIGGKTYLLDDSGKMLAGWSYANGVWYYSTNYGLVDPGWNSINSKKYYFNDRHEMLSDQEVEGKYLTKSGWVADGVVLDGEKPVLYTNGVKNTSIGFVENKGSVYYSDDSLDLADGWFKLNDTYYYFDNYVMQTGWIQLENNWYYLGANGSMHTGWLKLGEKYYYLNDNGTMQTGWLKLGNDWYYFNKYGRMQTGWIFVGNKWYYLNPNGVMRQGWLHLGNKWYYFKSNGMMAVGTCSVSGKYEYFGKDGHWLNPSSGIVKNLWRTSAIYSSTNYLILVDCANCRCYVYEYGESEWLPLFDWACSPGKPSTPTVKGTYTTSNKGLCFGHGYTCWYYTSFYGDYLFHSVLYKQGSTTQFVDARLGQQLSHGCVRLDINNAKWIYDYIPYGTTVYSF